MKMNHFNDDAQKLITKLSKLGRVELRYSDNEKTWTSFCMFSVTSCSSNGSIYDHYITMASDPSFTIKDSLLDLNEKILSMCKKIEGSLYSIRKDLE